MNTEGWYWVAEHRLWHYEVPLHVLRPGEYELDVVMCGYWIKPNSFTALAINLHGIEMSKQRGKTIWNI